MALLKHAGSMKMHVCLRVLCTWLAADAVQRPVSRTRDHQGVPSSGTGSHCRRSHCPATLIYMTLGSPSSSSRYVEKMERKLTRGGVRRGTYAAIPPAHTALSHGCGCRCAARARMRVRRPATPTPRQPCSRTAARNQTTVPTRERNAVDTLTR